MLPTHAGRAAPAGDLQITFLNVGRGDAELLRDAGGFTVLIDGGPPDANSALVTYLRQHAVRSINVMVVSHPDLDHIGGLFSVLQAGDITVKSVVTNGYPGDPTIWGYFLSALAARGLTPTPVQYPAVLQWGEMTAQALNPVSGLASPDTDEASLVLRVGYGETHFLFTGDISSTTESQILTRGAPVAAEILKVAHHSGSTSSSSGFLAQVGARESIIEVGENSEGLPAPDTLARLSAAGAAIWRTDRDGNVIVTSSGQGYTITGDAHWRSFYLPAAANRP